ncbi:MAG: hypothetical protein FJ125_02315 [Deltaproteobacteria bacterium]|nr:hypothetical protein [Deltaproteobacteria bacterium]
MHLVERDHQRALPGSATGRLEQALHHIGDGLGEIRSADGRATWPELLGQSAHRVDLATIEIDPVHDRFLVSLQPVEQQG